MKIYREKAGVLCEAACWVLVDQCWLYLDTSLLGLLKQVVCEWRHDRHLVG